MSIPVSVFRAALSAIRPRWRVALIVACVIGIGIGMATATLSIARQLLWNELPYHAPDRLVHIYETMRQRTFPRVRMPTYQTLKEHSRTLEQACAIRPEAVIVAGIQTPARVGATRVCEEFFALLGARPLLGRTFKAGNERNAAGNVAVVSEGFWKTRLGADRSVLGRTIRIGGDSATVIGVMASSFHFPSSRNAFSFDTIPPVEIWRPLGDPFSDYPSIPSQLKNFNHTMIGRLVENASMRDSAAELNVVLQHISQEYPRNYDETTIQIELLSEHFKQTYFAPVWIFIGAIFAFCLIAALNVSTLLMVQASGRKQEFATKLALGGTRLSILGQLIVEMVLVVLGGCLIGACLAWSVLKVIAGAVPTNLEPVRTVGVDLVAFIVSAALVILACVSIITVPYVRSVIMSGGNLLLSGRGRQDRIGGSATVRSLSTVLAFQLAIATVLLTGVGVLTRSFWQTMNEHPGFLSEKILTMKVGYAPQFFAENREMVSSTFDEILRQISAFSEVKSVGSVDKLPLDGLSNISTTTRFEGGMDADVRAEYRWIKGAYFSTMGIPLVRGQIFTGFETESEVRSALINESAARILWPNEDPIGKQFQRSGGPWLTVIGVVGDIRNDALSVMPRPQVYLKQPRPRMAVVVRTLTDPSNIMHPIRSLISEIDPTLAAVDFRTMDELVSESTSALKFCLVIAVLIASVSIILALFGVISLVAYSINQQRHSVGVRVAIGANPRQIWLAFERRMAVLVMISLSLGLAVVGASFGALESLLYKVEPWDTLTVATVSSLLAGACFAACWAVSRKVAFSDAVALLRS